MRDSFYTPPSLSNRLVSSVTSRSVRCVADFCIGGGELVRALLSRFPKASVYGVDISEEVISELAKGHKDWNLAVCDFMVDESRDSVSFLREKRFDLIILNPPFTCKGSTSFDIVFEGTRMRVSMAMRFILKALEYLSDDGGLYAILPISCIHSQKDHRAWSYLKEHYHACVLDEPGRFNFSKKCSPNIVIVYVGKYKVDNTPFIFSSPFHNSGVSTIVRGAISMQSLSFSHSKSALPLVHTTNMLGGRLVGLNKIIGGRIVDGPALLIPRVGNPKPGKLVLLDEGKQVVLSDCVVALLTGSQDAAENLKQLIHSHWEDFEHMYKGTGARYTTIARLNDAFGIKNQTHQGVLF